MKKIGIFCNDYKSEKFRQELIGNGFTKLNFRKHSEGVELITIETEETEIIKLTNLVAKIEEFFKIQQN